MSALSTFAYSYNRTHTATFVSDKLRNLLKVLVRDHGLDPQRLVDAWSDWVDRAVRTWLETGDLLEIVIEFYWPICRCGEVGHPDRTTVPATTWVDREFLRPSPRLVDRPQGLHRAVLRTRPGRPDVAESKDDAAVTGIW
jgi:hypothetical protein